MSLGGTELLCGAPL